MLIFMICVTILIAGIVCLILENQGIIEAGWIGILFPILGGMTTAILLIVFLLNGIMVQGALAEYKQSKAFIEMVTEDPDSSQIERTTALEQMLEWNKKIGSFRAYRESPFTNWLVQRKIAELELLELNEMPGKTMNVRVR